MEVVVFMSYLVLRTGTIVTAILGVEITATTIRRLTVSTVLTILIRLGITQELIIVATTMATMAITVIIATIIMVTMAITITMATTTAIIPLQLLRLQRMPTTALVIAARYVVVLVEAEVPIHCTAVLLLMEDKPTLAPTVLVLATEEPMLTKTQAQEIRM